MTVSDLYKRLQDTNGRRESKRKSTTDSNSLLRNTPTQGTNRVAPNAGQGCGPEDNSRDNSRDNPEDNESDAADEPRRQQMLKVLRASEARHKRKILRDTIISIGDEVIVLSGPLTDSSARVCDLDYIHSLALVDLGGSAGRQWLNLNTLAQVE